jgi:hypothetical protein
MIYLMVRSARRQDAGQTSLVDQLDWSPDSRVDAVRLRALPPVADLRADEVERRIGELEREARALICSIPWGEVLGADWRLRQRHLHGVRARLLVHIGGLLLIVRAPHLTSARRLRLLDAFDSCFAWERANLDEPYDDREHGSLRFAAAVREAARIAPPSLAAVGWRDRWTCALCGLPVLRQVPNWIRIHPLRASIDHVIPVSRGGPDVAANTRLAHGYCNSVRHDDTEERRARLARAHTRPLPARVLTAVVEWEREYAGDHLRNMRRWLEMEERSTRRNPNRDSALLRKLRRDVAAEEARLAGPAARPWERPQWYAEMLREAAERRSAQRGTPAQQSV